MDVDFLLDMCEGTFEGIGGIGNAEMGVMFEREEPGKVCLQTPVGAPETLVREVPAAGHRVCGFLTEKLFPATMPEREPVTETRLIGLRQFEDELPQFLPRFELRLSRDVPEDDLNLVELAHLDGNAGKGMHKPSPGIADNAQDVPTPPFQLLYARHVRRDGFAWEELPEEVLVTVRTAPHHDPENLPEVRRVHHHNHSTGLQETRLDLRLVHLLLHPPSAPPKPPPDLRVGLFSMRERLPKTLHFRCLLLSYFATARLTKPQLFSLVRSELLQVT